MQIATIPEATRTQIIETLDNVKHTLEHLAQVREAEPRTHPRGPRKQRRRYIARPVAQRPANQKITKRATQLLRFLDSRGDEGATTHMIQRKLKVNRNAVAGAVHVLKTAKLIITDLDVDPMLATGRRAN